MSDLQRVATMARQLTEVQDAISELTERLSEAKREERRISEEDLPQLMAEVGLSELTLASGEKVEITEQVQAAITEANLPAAVNWLVEHGFGGIVKTRIMVDYDYTERGEALAAFQEQAQYHQTELKETVHPATLKSFVREQLEAGNNVPMDLFSVHPFSKAKIKRAKK
jgi:hypothetical protein